MSERKLIRTKFIPQCKGPEGTPKPQDQPARNVEVFEYTDGSKDITCSNLPGRTCAISQTNETCLYLSSKAETSKNPPLFENGENNIAEKLR